MNDYLLQFGENVRRLRVRLGWSQEQLAAATGLHRTYIGSLERSERNVSLLNIIKLATALQVSLDELLQGIIPSASSVQYADIEAPVTDGSDSTLVRVRSSDAKLWVDVVVAGITTAQYQQIANSLLDGLARKEPAYHAVAQAMITAVQLCPDVNPADLWVHLIYRTYREAGKSAQSWVRVGGQALEQVILDIYAPRLAEYGIVLRKSTTTDALALKLREQGVGSSKTVLILEGEDAGQKQIFGVIHCKASIAERLSDDAPASAALIAHGLWSAVVTMDAKMYPPPHGNAIVRGELGNTKGGDKRRYFEVAGQFSACHSFNQRTLPSPGETASGTRIHSLKLSEEQPDVLVRDIIQAWAQFQLRRLATLINEDVFYRCATTITPEVGDPLLSKLTGIIMLQAKPQLCQHFGGDMPIVNLGAR